MFRQDLVRSTVAAADVAVVCRVVLTPTTNAEQLQRLHRYALTLVNHSHRMD
jgi:hypothetical protein